MGVDASASASVSFGCCAAALASFRPTDLFSVVTFAAAVAVAASDGLSASVAIFFSVPSSSGPFLAEEALGGGIPDFLPHPALVPLPVGVDAAKSTASAGAAPTGVLGADRF